MEQEVKLLQALVLVQQNRLERLQGLAEACEERPQLTWFCGQCETYRSQSYHSNYNKERKKKIRQKPIVRCTLCRCSICPQCVVECKACWSLIPGDWITRVCKDCANASMLEEMCLECIRYYSNQSFEPQSEKQQKIRSKAIKLRKMENFTELWFEAFLT